MLIEELPVNMNKFVYFYAKRIGITMHEAMKMQAEDFFTMCLFEKDIEREKESK